MLSSVSMNVKLFPPPHYFLSSLKHNVTVPTKARFTEAGAGSAEAPRSDAPFGDWQQLRVWGLLYIYAGKAQTWINSNQPQTENERL